MERAAEEARAGNLLYFQGLPADRLAPLLRRADADGRSLFHSACASGSLPLAQFLLDHGAPAEQAKQADEEVRRAAWRRRCRRHRTRQHFRAHHSLLRLVPEACTSQLGVYSCRAGRRCTARYQPGTSLWRACC